MNVLTLKQAAKAATTNSYRMNDKHYTVILVVSISHAVKAERLLSDAGIACKLVPVPRQFSSQCGVCVRVLRQDQEPAIDALTAGDLEIEGVYDL